MRKSEKKEDKKLRRWEGRKNTDQRAKRIADIENIEGREPIDIYLI